MFVKNLYLFCFLIILIFINCQGNGTEFTPEQLELYNTYKNICLPIPQGIDYADILQQDCRHLQKYPTNESEFYCCEVEFQEKKNKSAPVRHGCLAVLTNYIDNDRYEDWIDYIERGKLEQIQQYSIFLGRNASALWANFIKNRTKHKVFKFDCFSRYIIPKISLLFALAIFL